MYREKIDIRSNDMGELFHHLTQHLHYYPNALQEAHDKAYIIAEKLIGDNRIQRAKEDNRHMFTLSCSMYELDIARTITVNVDNKTLFYNGFSPLTSVYRLGSTNRFPITFSKEEIMAMVSSTGMTFKEFFLYYVVNQKYEVAFEEKDKYPPSGQEVLVVYKNGLCQFMQFDHSLFRWFDPNGLSVPSHPTDVESWYTQKDLQTVFAIRLPHQYENQERQQ